MTFALAAAVAAAMAASAAAAAAGGGGGSPPSIYSANFTSSSIDNLDILTTVERCEMDLTCAGVSFEPNGTVHKTRLYQHTFVGQYRTSKTYETAKGYTYHRGKITGGTVLEVVGEGEGDDDGARRITLAEAKERCRVREGCVAFTYPVRSLVGLLTLPNVTFVSTLEEFAPDDADEWRTYVTNDPTKLAGDDVVGGAGAGAVVNAEVLPYDEDVSDRPYRSCCTRTDIPPMREIAKADTLDRISCDISREEFFLQYEVPRKPVMLVGCEKDWPAAKDDLWLARNLAPRFSNASRWRARIGGDDQLNSEDYNHRVRWGDIVDAMLNKKAYYIFDQLFDPEAKVIDEDYEDPKPVRGGDLYKKLPYFSGPLRWFCHGPEGTGTQSHMDPFGTDAWNTVIKGHKWWLIYPEGFTDNDQLECEEECSVKVPLVKHWYASVGINGARTEFPVDKYAIHALQRPGETIYVPDGLLHSVYNMDETIAITKNYASAANLDNVWMETVTDGDKHKWRAMYYHTLNKEQRRRVRGGKYWPPQKWEKVKKKGGGRCKSTRKDEMDEYPMFGYDMTWYPEVGDLVEARYRAGSDGSNEWNTGRVTSIQGGRYTVTYIDDDTDVLTVQNMRRLPKVGDVVEAKYRGRYNEWYKAKVTDLTLKGTYDLKYFDGDVDHKIPRHSVREYRPLRKNEMVQTSWLDEGGVDHWVSSYIVEVKEEGANGGGGGDDGDDGNSTTTYRVRRYDGEFMDDVTSANIRRKQWKYKEGDEVIADIYWEGTYKWYKGVVAKSRTNGRYGLEFDDGDEEDCVSWRQMRHWWAGGETILSKQEEEGEEGGESEIERRKKGKKDRMREVDGE